MNKSKLEEKVILHQDITSMNASIAAHKKAAELLNAVMDEVKALGVEPTQIILNDLFETGEQIKKKLNRVLEKEIAGYLLPFRKEKARAEFNELLARVDKIVRNVDQDILQRDKPYTVYIETSLLTWVPGKIALDEQNIIDQFTIYLDSPGKIRIKELAEALLITIAEFNEAVSTASNGKVKGLTRNSPDDYHIVELFNNNSLSIDFTSFGAIN